MKIFLAGQFLLGGKGTGIDHTQGHLIVMNRGVLAEAIVGAGIKAWTIID